MGKPLSVFVNPIVDNTIVIVNNNMGDMSRGIALDSLSRPETSGPLIHVGIAFPILVDQVARV